VYLGAILILDPNTTYYWQVVPYNTTYGAATGCPVWSFTTGASTLIFDESFASETFPPSGWTVPTAGDCAWSRVTEGSDPDQTPYSPPAEAMFNSYDCDIGEYKQLLSPALDFSTAGEYRLTFWMYHDTDYDATRTDRVQVQISLDGGSTFEDVGNEIYRFTGAVGWAQHTLDLTAYAGESAVRIVFKGISGWGSNMFLDDVQVIQTVAVATPNCAILSAPANGAVGVPLVANLAWANGGGVPAGYKIYFGTDNPPTNIQNGADWGEATTYTQTSLLAENTLHYWQIVPYNSFGDATGCPVWTFTSGAAPLDTFPYVEGFESGAGGWTSGGDNSSWELGMPAGATIVGASTGNNAWKTNLDGDYHNDEQSYVQAPAFDFSGLTYPYVKFDLWWETEYDYDGVSLQASVDGGETWKTVGNSLDGFNWYSNYPEGLDFEPGWNGDPDADANMGAYIASYGWRTAMHNLRTYANWFMRLL